MCRVVVHNFNAASRGNYVILRIKGVGIATGWTAEVRNPAGATFSLFHDVKPALGPTQPPVKWAPEGLPRDKAAGA
jgi:hypothetical protein